MMIKLNTPYHVAEENVTVTFTEVKNGSITGTYTNATLTGTLEGNVLSATFHNTAVNAVGLIELTFNENGFEGKWKNGLEPGPMRGKWDGTIEADLEKNEVIGYKLYDLKEYTDNGLYSFIKKLNDILGEAGQMEMENQEVFLDNFYKQMNAFFAKNPEFIYLAKITEKISGNFDNVWFSLFIENDEEMMERFALKLDTLRDPGIINAVLKAEHIDISKINDDFNEFTRFSNLLSSYFVYSLDNVVEQNDAEELAEFILSISASNNSALSDEENAIPDQILDVLSGLGFDIHDYEGSSEIKSTYYLKNSLSSGYDYLAYSENIISELYCS
jgi:hypothetical protein